MGLAAKMAAAYNPPGESSQGAYYGEPPPQPNSIPTGYKQLLPACIQDKGLQSAYPPTSHILDQIAQQASAEINQTIQRWRIQKEIANDIVKLALYDIDDSGSMQFEDEGSRIKDLRLSLERVSFAATLFDADSISLRFMNTELSDARNQQGRPLQDGVANEVGQQAPPQGKYPPAPGWYFPQYYGTPSPQQAYGSPPQQEYGLPLPRAPYSHGTLPSSASYHTVHDVVAAVEAMKGFRIDEKRFIVLVDKDRVQTNPNRTEDDQQLRDLNLDLREELSRYFKDKEMSRHIKERLDETALRHLFSAYCNLGEPMKGTSTGEAIPDDMLTDRGNAVMNAVKEKRQHPFLRSLEADLKYRVGSGTENMYGIAIPGVNRDLTPPITMATLKAAIGDKGNNADPDEDLHVLTLGESFLNTSNLLKLSSMSTLSKVLTSLTDSVSGPSAAILAFVVPAGAVAIPGGSQEIQGDWKERILDLLTGDLVSLTEMVVPAILTVTSGFIAAKFLEKGRRGMCALFMLVSGVVFVTIRSPQHSDDDNQVRLLHAAVGLSYAFFTTVYCSLVVKKDDWSKGWTASAAGAAVLGTWVLMSIPSVSSYWKELTSLPSAFALAIGAPLSFAACEVVNYLTGPRIHGAGNQSHPLQNGMQNRPIGDRDDYDSRGFYPSVAYGFA